MFTFSQTKKAIKRALAGNANKGAVALVTGVTGKTDDMIPSGGSLLPSSFQQPLNPDTMRRALDAYKAARKATPALPPNPIIPGGANPPAAPIKPISGPAPTLPTNQQYSFTWNPADGTNGAAVTDKPLSPMEEALKASRDALARAYAKSQEKIRLESKLIGKDQLTDAQRRLAGSGISQNSGIYQKQLQRTEAGTARTLATNLANLDIDEADKVALQEFDIYKITTQDALTQAAEARKLKQQSYANLGATGGLSAAELAALKTSDPSLYDAYISGQTGQGLKVKDQNQTLRLELLKVAVAGLDPDSASYDQQLKDIYDSFASGNLYPEPGVTPTPKTPETPEQKVAREAAEVVSYQTEYDNTLARYLKIWRRYKDWKGDPYWKSTDAERNRSKIAYLKAKANLESKTGTTLAEVSPSSQHKTTVGWAI